MVQLLRLLCGALIGLFRSSARREAEILVLRQQINVLRRKSPKRPPSTTPIACCSFGCVGWFRQHLRHWRWSAPETVIRWHRAGFRAYWRLRSRPRGGRPKTPLEIRKLIRDMSIANPLWGAPRIHGELLKLGIDVGQTTVAKYMARRRRGPSQGWRTFLRNHADGIAQWICSSCRRSLSGCYMACWSCSTVGAESCGWERPRTRRLNGSPDN